jgi:hypothetical protein
VFVRGIRRLARWIYSVDPIRVGKRAVCQWHTDGCYRSKWAFGASGIKIAIGTGMVRVILMLLIRDGGGERWKFIPIADWQTNSSIWSARWAKLGGWGARYFILIALR